MPVYYDLASPNGTRGDDVRGSGERDACVARQTGCGAAEDLSQFAFPATSDADRERGAGRRPGQPHAAWRYDNPEALAVGDVDIVEYRFAQEAVLLTLAQV